MWVVLAGVLGLCIGSFLNVVIYRMPRQISVVTPRSRCSACQTPIPWYHNLPVLSYVLLRGRCSACQAQIPASYVLVEGVTALLFMGIFILEGPTGIGVMKAMLAALLLAASEIDRQHRIIPNRLMLGGLALAMSWALVEGWEASLPLLAAAGVTAGLLLLVRWLGLRLTGRIGIGMGDIKLAALLGLFLGWSNLWILYFAVALAAFVGIGGMVVKRLHRTSRLPFAPFMFAATLVHWFLIPDPWVLVL